MATVPVQARTWHRRNRRSELIIWAAWLFATALFVGCFQLISDKTIWAFVWDAPAQAGDLAVRMVPPDWPYIRGLGRPIWDTINIATIGRPSHARNAAIAIAPPHEKNINRCVVPATMVVHSHNTAMAAIAQNRAKAQPP